MSKREMVINYVPGEECRVAMVEDGKLADFHAERMDGPSNHVGSIYVGKVVNVEPAIQAAFIDFGLEHNGFLHVSDVHPQYFPGEDTDKTERVGKKTPRRERPPIQDCFRRGDEVAVQVLKEGVGTKGPTVTSYLSIPGRFLVMMPQMDKVGVSRKVEDEEQRRKMREILDQLDLPDGFGFILRTAGFDRTKAELKRDLAYLVRLWKDMERRWREGDKPRLLYSESDLLVRALRDLLTTDLDRVIVDNPAALSRAARFLKIVAPRTSTQLTHYTGRTPIFHATGIEEQIQMIHAREVPLESGGRLVIDEAEALVAIDVNSGKSRDARDSETNALRTNLEAADEICRQLRLRDLGGVIVNDFIDMRSIKHRRELENRVRDNLKRDRARWTIAPISEFGILEMTRQRMRASHESQHFADCPTCRGRGMVQRPDSVASDALRELTALLDHDKVKRVEVVVHPRIAGELLSSRRKALSRIERASGKQMDVRVSEAVLVDRVTFYAYDDKGDLDLSRLGTRKLRDEELVNYEITSDAAENWAEPDEPIEAPEDEIEQDELDVDPHPIELEPVSLDQFADRPRQQPQHQQQQGGYDQQGDEGGEGGRRRRRRRGRRGGRGRDRGFDGPPQHGGPGEPAFDSHGAPIESAQSPDAYNAEDDEALVADPSHATGYGQHHHEQHGYDSQGEDQYNEPQQFDEHGQPIPYQPSEQGFDQQRPVRYDEFGNPLPDDGRRRRRRRRGRRGGRGRNDNFNPNQPSGQFSDQNGQYPQQGGDGPEGQAYDQAANVDESGQYIEHNEPGPQGPGEYVDGEEGGYADAGEPNQGDGGYDNAGQGYGPGPNDQGDGGPRRRRRRRGRHGGRNGNGGGEFNQGRQQQQPRGQGPRRNEPGAPSLADMFRDNGPAGSFEGGEGSGEVESDFAPMNEQPAEYASENEPMGDEGAPVGGPIGDNDAPPSGDDRPQRRRGGRGRGKKGPPDRDDAPSAPAPARSPRPEPAPARASRPESKPATPAKPEVKPPRTLYATRRRVAAKDIKNTKRED
jgi:ribonuclease E